MSRSTGYKINKNLCDFLVNSGADSNNLIENIFTVRAIVGKFQKQEEIAHDLEEIMAEAQAKALESYSEVVSNGQEETEAA